MGRWNKTKVQYNKYIVFVFVGYAFLGCIDDSKLSGFCPATCFSGDADMEGVGACRAGTPVCDAKFNIVACIDEVLPKPEVCDDIDNDCDGVVDGQRKFASRFAIPEDFPCKIHGECGNSAAVCVDGRWACAYGDTVELDGETRCDGLDNDCDGRIDEDLFVGELCYTGTIGTALNAPCHPGGMACVAGEVLCTNQVVPSVERCDTIDNDCNGVVDDLSAEFTTLYDIVLGLDTSASMLAEIAAVLGALGEYVDQFSGGDVRFSIVDISRGDSPYVVVDTDFSDISVVYDRLLYMGPSGRGEEASLDAPYMVCGSRKGKKLPLTWRDGAHGIYLGFTDEAPQSYATLPLTQASIVEECNAQDVRLYQWSYNGSEFEYMTSTTGGQNFRLSANHEDILRDLNTVLLSLCSMDDD